MSGYAERKNGNSEQPKVRLFAGCSECSYLSPAQRRFGAMVMWAI